MASATRALPHREGVQSLGRCGTGPSSTVALHDLTSSRSFTTWKEHTVYKCWACILLQPCSLRDSRCSSCATVLTVLRKNITPNLLQMQSGDVTWPSHAAYFLLAVCPLLNIWGRGLLFTGFSKSKRGSLAAWCNLFAQIDLKTVDL